jgi:hypothetical protein
MNTGASWVDSARFGFAKEQVTGQGVGPVPNIPFPILRTGQTDPIGIKCGGRFGGLIRLCGVGPVAFLT